MMHVNSLMMRVLSPFPSRSNRHQWNHLHVQVSFEPMSVNNPVTVGPWVTGIKRIFCLAFMHTVLCCCVVIRGHSQDLNRINCPIIKIQMSQNNKLY